MTDTQRKSAFSLASLGIVVFCFGYFASYVPYSMMTKMITKGLFSGMNGVGIKGFSIQPAVALGSMLTMFLFFTLAGWWKHATHSKIFGISFPRPQWYTFISGIFMAGILVTTTLAYTFDGISIVFAMLLMRGGVLVLAPIVDTFAKRRKRKVYWPSWIASILSLAALIIAFIQKTSTAMTVVAAADITIYLLAYFFRLFIMSNRAKSDDPIERKRYLVEEQMVGNPILFFGLVVIGIFGSSMVPDSLPGQIWEGISSFAFTKYFWYAFVIGIFSYGTGIFGGMIFLDKRENTFTVPANRISSVFAGVIASYLLAMFYGEKFPPLSELIGVALVTLAIVFLAYRSIVEKREARRAKAGA